MESIGDFIGGLVTKLENLTGLDPTICFIIVLVVGGFLIGTIWDWLFGSSKSKGNPTSTHYNSNASNQEAERRRRLEEEEVQRSRAREQEEARKRERARELHKLEILEGRRRNEGW